MSVKGRSDRSKKARHARLSARRRGALIAELVYYDVIYERDEGTCQICWQPVKFEEGTMDHKIPISRGGPHIYTNIQLSCRPCNIDKGSEINEFSLSRGEGRQTPSRLRSDG